MLPVDFTDRMSNILGNEYDDFISSYNKPRFHSLRINPLKTSINEFTNNFKYSFTLVPWENNGFYYDDDITPGKHPYHEAGVYYIQEPSAMAPASYIDAKPNEINAARAKILSENIERMGITNAIVTNESPQSLSKHFVNYFDKIMVDAPCSGEEMFRKNSAACDEWSLENVEICAKRQLEILNCAASMLKCGVKIVYSTCTFAPSENEGTIENFLKSHEDFSLEILDKYEGMSDGFIKGTIRLWPHKLNGEGHFVAMLKKSGV